MSESELDSHLTTMGVAQSQRKNIIAAAKLGVANSLKQLGLSLPPMAVDRSRSLRRRSRSGRRRSSRSPRTKWPAYVGATPTAVPSAALPVARSMRMQSVRPPPEPEEEDEQDVDGFLAGGQKVKATMAKAKADEKAHREEMERLKDNAARRQDQEDNGKRKAAEAEQKRRTVSESARAQKELHAEQQMLDRLKEAKRRARREEKSKRREASRREKGAEDGDGRESSGVGSERAPSEDRRPRRPMDLQQGKGFFGEAFRGNEDQKRIWSEPIKGQVSNNNRGMSDAELDRRFGAPGAATGAASQGGKPLLTEEEVLKMLRKGKPKS